MRQLLLVRHGESRWNAEGRIQGQACAGLSERGHAQAQALGDTIGPGLAQQLATDPAAVRLVTSDLQRATETAAPVARRLGLDPVHDRRLRERSFGRWEGRSHTELANDDPERYRRWTTGVDVMGEIGAETATELADRVAPALAELLTATPRGGVTVVVSHGGSIWHGLHRLFRLPPRSLGPVGNASVAQLLLLIEEDVAPGRIDEGTTGGNGTGRLLPSGVHPVLASYNDLAHLPVELRTGGFATGTTSDAVPQMR
ncbi:MAG: histidine phosphatase family protein [Nitriliruptoraceae bacterium]